MLDTRTTSSIRLMAILSCASMRQRELSAVENRFSGASLLVVRHSSSLFPAEGTPYIEDRHIPRIFPVANAAGRTAEGYVSRGNGADRPFPPSSDHLAVVPVH